MKDLACNGRPPRTCGGSLVAALLAVALTASVCAAALAVAATIPAFAGVRGDDLASGSGEERAKTPRGAIPTPPPAEIRELVALLVDEDLEVRKAASDRLVAIGESALPILEEEMRRRRLGAMGQVKITLLKLRSLREDRLWNEALERLAAKPSETTLRAESPGARGVGRGEGRAKDGGPGPEAGSSPTTVKRGGKVVLRSTPAADGQVTVEVAFESERGEPRRVLATLARDRTLSPRTVEVRDGERQTARLEISAGRVTGTAPTGAIDAPASPPICLDWAVPLVVAAMPRVAETELVFTLLRAESGQTEGLRTLHCLGEQAPKGSGRAKTVTAYELRGEHVATRRFEVDEHGRIVLAELGPA